MVFATTVKTGIVRRTVEVCFMLKACISYGTYTYTAESVWGERVLRWVRRCARER